jgi:hypothetical protein
MFPSYVLENLYVKKSLYNNHEGFELKLKNNIESGTITGLGPIVVDGESFSVDKVTLKVKDKEIKADQISSSSPLLVYVLSEIAIYVKGNPLPSGKHKVEFVIQTQEAGQLRFSITDDIKE